MQYVSAACAWKAFLLKLERLCMAGILGSPSTLGAMCGGVWQPSCADTTESRYPEAGWTIKKIRPVMASALTEELFIIAKIGKQQVALQSDPRIFLQFPPTVDRAL